MASPTATERANNYANAVTSANNMNTALTQGGYNARLVAKIVPVAFKVVVEQNPTSPNTEEEDKTLANDTLNIEFYEE